MAGCSSSSAASDVQSAADVKRIAPAEARTLLEEGTAVLYDTRSLNQYRTQRAAGAISLPEGEEEARFSELPADKSLIFYCT
jgi:rhodanese-related sulfurtransferase